ncbi:MAG: gliding motility-associated-like protein [Crocinitomicaceae bacterium]|jgi:gliding motility-associated-like protein
MRYLPTIIQRLGLLLLLTITLSTLSVAQNLVTNPGFETYSSLPTGPGQWSNAVPWSNVNGWIPFQWPYASPDYCHTSGTGSIQLPNTVFGTVNAYAGDGIMGMITYYVSTSDFREYLAIQLSSPMTIGTTYTISFHVTSGLPGNYGGMGISNFGVCLSSGALTQVDHEPINVTPQFLIGGGTPFYSSTWQLVTFTITATQAFDHLTFGNFDNDAVTIPLSQTFAATSNPGAYYFLDEVSVIAASQPPITVNLGADTTLCTGTSLLLDATTPNSTYLWQDNSILPTFNVTTAGTYWVQVTDNLGSIATDTIVVDYVNPPSVNLGPDTSVCAPFSVTLDATYPGATYMWQDGSVNPTYTATASSIYSVDVTNQCGTVSDAINITVLPQVQPVNLGPDASICAGQVLQLVGTTLNASDYLWQDGSTSPTFTVSTPGVYWVQASNQCGMLTDSIVITLIDAVAPFTLGNDTTICQGELLNLDANTPFAANYLWQDGTTNPIYSVSQTGMYTVQASNQCGTETASIYVNVIPLIIDLGNDTTICLNDALTVDAGPFGVTYIWSNGLTDQVVSLTDPGTYWVTVSTGACTSTDSITIEVQELFPAFSAPIRDGCEPNQLITFMDESTISSGSIIGWDWSFGNQEISTAQNPNVNYQNAGIYDVNLTITSNLGCVETVNYADYITIYPNAIANFGFSLESGIALEATNFLNTSQFSEFWTWDFGDGNSSTYENPTHSYLEAGSYVITLIANNPSGCADTIVQNINVVTDPIVYVPNAFTPDQDEHNQLWRPIISEIDIYDYSVLLFNRWGEVIWESHDPAQGWDGTYQGITVQAGVYSWKIEASHAENDKRFTYSGHLTLLR